MNILMVTQYFWPETFRIAGVAQSLRDAGSDVTVLTGRPNYPDGVVLPGYSAASFCTQIHDGLTIRRVRLVPRGRRSALRLVLNFLSFIMSAEMYGPWVLRGQRFNAFSAMRSLRSCRRCRLSGWRG